MQSHLWLPDHAREGGSRHPWATGISLATEIETPFGCRIMLARADRDTLGLPGSASRPRSGTPCATGITLATEIETPLGYRDHARNGTSGHPWATGIKLARAARDTPVLPDHARDRDQGHHWATGIMLARADRYTLGLPGSCSHGRIGTPLGCRAHTRNDGSSNPGLSISLFCRGRRRGLGCRTHRIAALAGG
jgi:hypothetical protein